MKSISLKLLLASTLAFSSSLAFAVPILQGSTDAATGIFGLDIGGDLYDVQFSTMGVSYNVQFPLDDATFLGSSPNAVGAVAAISAFLTNQSVRGISDLSSSFEHSILVPFFTNAANVSLVSARQSGIASATWNFASGSNESRNSGFPNGSWATFTPSVAEVPEPASVTLLLLGLLGLAQVRRQRLSN